MKYLYPIFARHTLLTFSIVAFIVFFKVLFNDFVWLDHPYILNNPEAHGINVFDIFSGSSFTAQGYYRPISALYLSTLHTIFSDQVFFYHVVQIGLRVLNTYLLFRLFSKFFNQPISILLSLTYLVHPINQAQVAFISSIADIMTMTFGLGALLIASRIEQKTWHIITASILLLLSILSKESGFLFIIATLAYQVIFQRKFLLRYLLYGGIAIALYLGLRMYFHELSQPDLMLYPMARLSLLERLINIPQIYSFYIEKFFVPNKIGGVHIWTHTEITMSTFYIPLLIDTVFIGGITALGVFIYTHARKLFTSFLFFLCMYVPGQMLYLQIIPLDYTVSDRWFVFAMIGLLGMIGTGFATIKFTPRLLHIVTLLSVILLVFLSYKTFVKNAYWKDDISLFTRWSKNDNNFVVQNWLANAYYSETDYLSALKHANMSVTMFPYDNNLMLQALTLEKLSKKKEAKIVMEKAINADNFAPGYHDPQTYSQLLQYLIRNNEHVAAKELALLAIQDYPTDAYFWSMLAAESYIVGDKNEAKSSIEKALQLSPDIPQIQEINDAIKSNKPL